MKIIFLDIDGVLNNAVDAENHPISNDPKNIRSSYFYSARNVQLLNRITKHTDAKIVISSTWRLGAELQELQELCALMGIEGEVISMTDDLNNGHTFRGNEIYKWIKDNDELIGSHHEFTKYVILDDDSDMLYWQRRNFIHVNGYIGLTERDSNQSILILNGEYPEFDGTDFG